MKLIPFHLFGVDVAVVPYIGDNRRTGAVDVAHHNLKRFGKAFRTGKETGAVRAKTVRCLNKLV